MKVFNNNADVNAASTKESSARDNTIDIVAGILIIRMILGHYMAMCHLKETTLYESLHVLFFFMPWFFYKSGMFCSKEKRQNSKFLKDNLRKFIVPFIIFSIAGSMIGICSAMATGKSIIYIIDRDRELLKFHGSTSWNSPLWFLNTLFLVRVSFNYIRDIVNHYALIVVLLALAFFHYLFLVNRDIFWIGNFCSGLIFYILGMKLHTIQYNKYVLLCATIVLITIGIIKPTIVTMFGNYLLYDNGIYLLWYPFCLAGIIVFNNLIKKTNKFFVHYNFEDIGKHSMTYYVIHFPIGLLIRDLYTRYSDSQNNWELLVYICMVWLCVSPFLTYLFNTKRLSKFIGK